MPFMICARNYTLATTSGHTIGFKANEPRNVPDVCVPDALKVNIIFAKSSDLDGMLDKQDAESARAPARYELTGHYRTCAILAVMDEIVTRNATHEFTGGGRPKVSVVRNELNMQSVSEHEVSKLWDTYRDCKNNGLDLPTAPDLDDLLRVQRCTAMSDALMYAEHYDVDISALSLSDARPVVMAAIINGAVREKGQTNETKLAQD